MTDNFVCTRRSIAVEIRGSDTRRELDALRLEIAELRASRRRLVLSADAARRGFERALHDGLQQQLVGLAANLELAARSVESDPSSAVTLLAEMRGDLREALDQTRTLAHRIYPPLEAGGLVPALRSAAANADVSIRIDVSLGTSVPTEIAAAVYFSCFDVLERARGTSMTISVREEHGGVAFDILVDREMEVEPSPIRDRVEAMGGSLTIRSEPGPRTVWTGFLPLPR
jgi:signal transduction histidine kinase